MEKLLSIIDLLSDVLKATFSALTSLLLTTIMPIQDYFKVIILLATVNIIAGLIADRGAWSFGKAFDAVLYLLGYLSLLLISALVCLLMHVPDESFIEFSSWLTWVMIYFYVTNILRNWNKRQPKNQVVAFLFWVFSFKIVDKIQYLKEYLSHEKTKDHGNE